MSRGIFKVWPFFFTLLS